MKFESLKELLLRKSSDDTIKSFIKSLDGDMISDLIMESLNKAIRGKLNHPALREFMKNVTPEDVSMVRDAVGHHISHHNAAIKEGNQALANQHATQAFRLLNMLDKGQNDSYQEQKGSAVPKKMVNLEMVDPKGWERNHLLNRNSKYVEGEPLKNSHFSDTKGLNYSNLKPDQRNPNNPKGKDYRFLQGKPNELYHDSLSKDNVSKNAKGESESDLHRYKDSAYPWHAIKINGKHVFIDHDVEGQKGKYVPHPFDHHPVMQNFEDSPTSVEHETAMANYGKGVEDFLNNGHIDKHYDKLEADEKKHGQKPEYRGEKPSNPVHASPKELEDVYGDDPEKLGHIKAHKDYFANKTPAQQAQKIVSENPERKPETQGEVSPDVAKMTNDYSQGKLSFDELTGNMQKLLESGKMGIKDYLHVLNQLKPNK